MALNRDEANKPIFWNGENQGEEVLMRLRQQIKGTHPWSGPYEQQKMLSNASQVDEMGISKDEVMPKALNKVSGEFH